MSGFFGLILCFFALPSDGKTLTYFRTTGSERVNTIIKIAESPKGMTITKHNKQEDVKIVCDKRGGTLRWEFSSKKIRAKLIVVRQKNWLKVKGKLNGKPVDKALEIDGAPWYQDVGFNAKRFILSSANTIKFWSFHPQKLTVYRMKMEKIGTETLTIKGNKIEAVKTKVRIDKFFLSMMWSALHWNRKSDGLFLKYKSRHGGPGTPMTNVILTSGM